jgi:hypothetical protein
MDIKGKCRDQEILGGEDKGHVNLIAGFACRGDSRPRI